MRTLIFDAGPRHIVAANVRARMAWAGITRQQLSDRFGWSKRTTYNKLAGATAITDFELADLAGLFGLEDPGPLFRIPESFPAISGSESACSNETAGRHLYLAYSA